MRRRLHGLSNQRAFTLIEVVVSMAIALILGLSAIASIVYTRQSMELEKQRLSALNFCRKALEAAEANDSLGSYVGQLVPFNAPGVEINANVEVAFYDFFNGVPQWDGPLPAAPGNRPALCRVTVSWQPSGSWSRRQMVQMDTIVRAGTL